MPIFKALLLYLSLVTLISANSIGLNINQKDVEASASIKLERFVSPTSSTVYLLDASYINANGDNLTSFGISGKNSLQTTDGVYLAFGAKFVTAKDYAALPLFARVDFVLPLDEAIPETTLGATLAYAPSVLSYFTGAKYQEFRIEATMEVIPNILLYTGYRTIDTEYKSYNKIFSQKLYGGLKLSF